MLVYWYTFCIPMLAPRGGALLVAFPSEKVCTAARVTVTLFWMTSSPRESPKGVRTCSEAILSQSLHVESRVHSHAFAVCFLRSAYLATTSTPLKDGRSSSLFTNFCILLDAFRRVRNARKLAADPCPSQFSKQYQLWDIMEHGFVW